MTTADQDHLRGALMTFGEEMLPFVEFAEGQQKLLTDRGWPEEAAAQHAYLTLCDLRAWYFAILERNAVTAELRTRRMEQLI